MTYADISIKLFIFMISSFLMMQFVPTGFAVKEWRESERNGGWQIWVSATDFVKIQGIETSKTDVESWVIKQRNRGYRKRYSLLRF